MLPPFELSQPTTLPEALSALAAGDGQPYAGGTILVPDLRGGREKCRRFISLAGLEELRFIGHDDEGTTLGACTTIADIAKDPEMAIAAPALAAAADVFAGAMVRSVATIGGNICCGSPSADMVPALLTLGAEVTLSNSEGKRKIPLSAFYADYKKSVLKPGELLTAVSWKPLRQSASHLFFKLARRKGDAITVTGVSVMMAANDGKCSKVRIALGSVAPTVFRASQAEDMLRGRALTAELIEKAAKAAADQCSPIDDSRASAAYRLQTAQALVRRQLTQAWHQASSV
ncbi:MAG: xanthine dehydrogenase family protein subunit M [Rhodobacteraceae bacterium]|nr:xanthine dehydrogenase family protein subunit M [Paracoccaceae bacterium]